MPTHSLEVRWIVFWKSLFFPHAFPSAFFVFLIELCPVVVTRISLSCCHVLLEFLQAPVIRAQKCSYVVRTILWLLDFGC